MRGKKKKGKWREGDKDRGRSKEIAKIKKKREEYRETVKMMMD